MTRVSVPVGIIGAGYFGGEHARAIASLGGRAHVVAVASRTLDSAAALATGTARAYDDWRKLIDDPQVAAVCICTPHDLHESIAVAAAAAGKAILLEKPMATTLDACDRIAAATAQVPFMVGQPSRFIPAFARARELIAKGRIGRPLYARVAMIKAWQLAQRKPWHLDPARGGGMWLTNGIHMVDRLTLMMGALPAAVTATIGTRIHDGMAVDDVGVALFQFADGRAGVIEAIGYASGAPAHDCVVTGTKGMLKCHHHDGVATGQDETWTSTGGQSGDWREDALAGEWNAFLAHIDGKESAVPASLARAHMACVLAARESAARDERVGI